MAIRSTNRLALVAAIVVVASALGSGRLAASPAYAAPAHVLAAGDFHEAALQGFGDPQNSWAWSMAWYKNSLYVGTNRSWGCYQRAVANASYGALAPYPPINLDLAYPCAPAPQNLPLAAEIWRLNPISSAPLTQTNWTRVYQSPYGALYNGQPIMVNITRTNIITPAARDVGFRAMTVYDDVNGDQALYVSGHSTSDLNGPNVPPPSLLRMTDGVTFQAVPSAPGTTMDNINRVQRGGTCLRGSVSYKGEFYVIFCTIIGWGLGFVSPDPRLGNNSFQQFTPPGMTPFELMPFNGHLYLGLWSNAGYSVVRTDGCASLPCSNSDFKQVVPPGAGLGAQADEGVTSMQVFTDTNGVAHLYVGTESSRLKPAELIRVNTDDTWDLVVGNPRLVSGPGQCYCIKYPTSGLGAGFDWWFNEHMWRMAVYNGVLYVGTFDNSTSFRHFPILGPLLQPLMGFDLWASTDGLTFTPVTLTGFGDAYSFGVRSLAATPDGLFLGSANTAKGLRIWQGGASMAALQAAPKDVQIDTPDTQGAALTWDVPNGAQTFHIYRATETQAPLPSSGSVAVPTIDGDSSVGVALSPRTVPRTVWVPGPYTEIGATTAPYFVDHGAQPGGHYSYYVVAQDGNGNLSAASNVATDPALRPLPTFHDMGTVLAYLAARGKVSYAQADKLRKAILAAYLRLRFGDARGSHDALATLRQDVLAPSAHGPNGGLYREYLAVLLDRLERRVALVDAHVLSASRLN